MSRIKFTILLFVVLVIGVLFYIPGFLPFRTNKEFVAEWAVIFFIVLFLKNRWLGAFLLWTMFTMIMRCRVPVVGLNKAYILGLHIVVIYAVFYDYFITHFKRKHLDILLNTVAVVGIFQVLMILIQYNGTWAGGMLPLYWRSNLPDITLFLHPLFPAYVWYVPREWSCTGFMDMVNTSSGLLAICLPVFFRKQWRWGIPFIFAGLWISRSLGGLLPAVLVMAIYFIVRERRWRWFIVVTLGLFLAFFFMKFEHWNTILTGNKRFEIWDAGMKIYTRRWLCGWGIRQSPFLWMISAKMLDVPARWSHYHNEYISLAIELGFVGIAIVTGFFASLFLKIQKYLKDEGTLIVTLAVLVGLINSIVNFTMHNVVGLVFLTFIAGMDAITRGDKNGDCNQTSN